jgi:hypothetical protein
MAADIARHMHSRAGRRTSAHGVRAAVQTLRKQLEPIGLDYDLLLHRSEGYSLNIGPGTGLLEDRIWFWSDDDAWWSPDISR